MKNLALLTGLVAVAALAASLSAWSTGSTEAALVHNVFFSLKDNSPEAKARFIETTKKHLGKTPNATFFATGLLAAEFDREVNDRDFDVALTLVFKNKAAHDVYQDSPAHQAFIAEARPNVQKVRVFDSYIAP